MNASIYSHMQAAVDIVGTSPHPANKIAATIAGEDFTISRTNHWPETIETTIGQDTKIGNSSGTIHAETACILAAMQNGYETEDAMIFVTDPPCPNCMKNMAEAGITKLYIDHKGFDKDWARRRGDSFETMSMRIAEKAGMDVYVLHRKEQRYETISSHVPDYQPSIENPPVIAPLQQSEDVWKNCIKQTHEKLGDEPFALALAKDTNGAQFSILTDRHPTIGYTSQTLENKEDKYSVILQPVARILMIAARHGLLITPEHLYSSRVPTARELVNVIGAGLSHIHIGDPNAARDQYGSIALNQLQKARVLETKILSISSL